MHELSIVMSIVDTATEKVKEHHATSVESIDLVIGALAGVDDHALEFSWEAGVKNTVLQQAQRNIIRMPGKAKCSNCGAEFEIKELFDPCPACGDHLIQVIQGKELQIKSITLN